MSFQINLSENVIFTISFFASAFFIFFFILWRLLKTQIKYKSKKEMKKVYFVRDWFVFVILFSLSLICISLTKSLLKNEWQQILIEIFFSLLPLVYFLIFVPKRIRKFYFPKFYFYDANKNKTSLINTLKKWKKLVKKQDIHELKSARKFLSNDSYKFPVFGHGGLGRLFEGWANDHNLKFE